MRLSISLFPAYLTLCTCICICTQLPPLIITKRRLKITHHEDELASVKMLSVFGCSLRANSCSPAVSTFCASAICSAVV